MSSTERTARRAGSAFDDITARGGAAWRGASTGIEGAMADATEKGREALDSARDVRDTLSDMVLTSIKERPYTTLALAALAGFAYGALRRR